MHGAQTTYVHAYHYMYLHTHTHTHAIHLPEHACMCAAAILARMDVLRACMEHMDFAGADVVQDMQPDLQIASSTPKLSSKIF